MPMAVNLICQQEMVSVVEISTAACNLPERQCPYLSIRYHLRELALCACFLSLLVLSPSAFHQLGLLTSSTTPQIPMFSALRIGLPVVMITRQASTLREAGADGKEILTVAESMRTAGEEGGRRGAAKIWNKASEQLTSIFIFRLRDEDFQWGRKQGPREFMRQRDAGVWEEDRFWLTRAGGEDFIWGSDWSIGRGKAQSRTDGGIPKWVDKDQRHVEGLEKNTILSDSNLIGVRRELIDVEVGEVESEGEWEEWGGDDYEATRDDTLSLDLAEGEWEGDDLGTILEIAHAAAEEQSLQ